MKQRFLIRRLKCSNCGRLHRELPDCLVPYKHYASEVISGAKEFLLEILADGAVEQNVIVKKSESRGMRLSITDKRKGDIR